MALTADFRYDMWAYYVRDHDRADSWMEYQIIVPGSSTGSRINANNGGETCRQSGCRDTSLSRDLFACRPIPSVTYTPTSSKTPTATPSLPFEASDAFASHNLVFTVHFRQTAPPAPSGLFRESAPMSDSGEIEQTAVWNVTNLFVSVPLNESVPAPATGDFEPTAPFRISLVAPSDYFAPNSCQHFGNSGRFRPTAPLVQSGGFEQSVPFLKTDVFVPFSSSRSSISPIAAISIGVAIVLAAVVVAIGCFWVRREGSGVESEDSANEIELTQTGQVSSLLGGDGDGDGFLTEYAQTLWAEPGVNFATELRVTFSE
jgi:hypothetical protein